MSRTVFAALVVVQILTPLHAAKIELEFKGQKQVVEFDPGNPKDLDRAEKLWMKADYKKFYVYSEIGGFQVCEEPRDDSKCETYGGWYQELSTSSVTSPYLASIVWDKKKWHPRFWDKKSGWLKLDDPNLIWPNQLKPMKEWPIRYIAYYRGTDTAAAEEGIKPKYDEYERWHFDKEGFVLNNRTMKREVEDGILRRMFRYRDFVKVTGVSARDPDTPVSPEGGMGYAFNLKKIFDEPKISYEDATPVSDRGGGNIFVWATFEDTVKPIHDKFNPAICIVDCKNRKRWAP